jgi:hypothetical protein
MAGKNNALQGLRSGAPFKTDILFDSRGKWRFDLFLCLTIRKNGIKKETNPKWFLNE